MAAVKKPETADAPKPAESADEGTFATEVRPVPDKNDIVNEAVLTDSAEAHIDRVVMPSLKADGTPDQTPGFEVLKPSAEPESRDV